VTPVAEVAEVAEVANVGAAARPLVHEEQVRALLDTVPDPEIPNVSITELGMIGAIDVSAGRIRVELLPTFVGCPAVELIRTGIAERLGGLGSPVEVVVSFTTPWTTDRISPAGRDKLRQSGFAPPPPAASSGRSLPVLDLGATRAREEEPTDGITCPYCGSSQTVLDSAFGPTLCRSIRHCAACRQPFEAFKTI
jgi:ring-1,2-phenylacetyl-CoA epoxidase subunit PaaD